MEKAATFAVCRMIRHDVSHQHSYKPSIGLPRSARAGQANARDQVSLRVEGQFPQRPKDLETSGIGQLRKDGFGYITVRYWGSRSAAFRRAGRSAGKTSWFPAFPDPYRTTGA